MRVHSTRSTVHIPSMEGIDYSEKIVHSTVHTIGVRTLLGGGRENTVLTYLPTYTSGLLDYCTTTSTHTFPPIHMCIVSNLNISTLNYLPLLNQLSTLNSEHSTLAHSHTHYSLARHYNLDTRSTPCLHLCIVFCACGRCRDVRVCGPYMNGSEGSYMR